MQQNKLFVGNLPFDSNEGDLQEAFEQFGEIDEIRVIIDRETGRSRGFAFVTFAESDAANDALALDGKELNGRNLRVNFATERTGGGRRRHQNPGNNNKH
ncbi:RNA-binding protein [Endozoicomonas sp. OPT23]|uniref:RNA recognition motif domain-containing protein n=1 Tax=Endozoicomonas sp. OPT23 TaxID=2072845 RepID=UPI00129A6D1E|nr:RNA-binding protein [Endozoicomonas sp. OPT23]MRI34441.1 RNA-binding protein [Endozoicomonas sp. OPT23]